MSNPYVKSVRHLDEIDAYIIGNLYEVKSHAVFHALKKLLCAGKRGAKDYEQDLMEAIESIERELQMLPVAQEKEVSGDPGKGTVDKEKVQPVAIGQAFDEQRIDAIGQNGGEPHYDDWRLKVDWSLASPHHQFAAPTLDGRIMFSMHQPMQGDWTGRPTAQ